MKLYFEGTAEELAALRSAQASDTALTKEIFMHSMQELSDQIKADKDAVINYITTRDAADVELQAKLTAALATVATDEAQLAAMTAKVDATFADAKTIADTVNPPPVVVAPPVVVDTGNSAGGTGASPAPTDGTSSGAAGSGDAAADPSLGGAAPAETPVAVDPSLGGDASGTGSSEPAATDASLKM